VKFSSAGNLEVLALAGRVSKVVRTATSLDLLSNVLPGDFTELGLSVEAVPVADGALQVSQMLLNLVLEDVDLGLLAPTIL
jgi:hypothetical protein